MAGSFSFISVTERFSSSETPTVTFTRTGTPTPILGLDLRYGNTLIKHWSLPSPGIFTPERFTATLTTSERATLIGLVPTDEQGITVTFEMSSGGLTTQSKTATFYLDEDIYKPTISGISFANTPVIFNNKVLQNHLAQCTVTASAKSGATITAYRVVIGARVYTGASVTFTPTVSGTLDVSVRVTDSRGLVTESATSLIVTPYDSPRFSNLEVFRCTDTGEPQIDGINVHINCTCLVSPVDGNNHITEAKYRINESGVTPGDYSNLTVGTDGEVSQTVTNCVPDITKAYILELSLKDTVGITRINFYNVPADNPALHLTEGNVGIALGQYYDATKVSGGETSVQIGYAKMFVKGIEQKVIKEVISELSGGIAARGYIFTDNTIMAWFIMDGVTGGVTESVGGINGRAFDLNIAPLLPEGYSFAEFPVVIAGSGHFRNYSAYPHFCSITNVTTTGFAFHCLGSSGTILDNASALVIGRITNNEV